MDRTKLIEEQEEALKIETENLHNFYMTLVMPEYRDVISSGQLMVICASWREIGGLSALYAIRATIDENFEEKGV